MATNTGGLRPGGAPVPALGAKDPGTADRLYLTIQDDMMDLIAYR